MVYHPLVRVSLLFFVLLLNTISADDCFRDVPECIPAFRARYLDIDRFYYGTTYSEYCPEGLACTPQPAVHQSVISRILYTNDTAAAEAAVYNMGILNVTFMQEERSYFSCNHNFELQSGPPATVPPLDLFLIPILHLHFEPQVTWRPRSSSTRYMVVFYDAGSYFLHSLYVNCQGGSLSGCEPVRRWLGPAVSFLQRTSYVFLVYEQTSILPVQVALFASFAATDQVTSNARMDLLLNQLTAFVDPTIRYSVILELIPDPYSNSVMNRIQLRTQCPMYYSQLPTFHSAVHGMQVPSLKWAPPNFSQSQVASAAQLTTLSVDIDVTYVTKPVSVENVCCQSYSVGSGIYKTDPFNEEAWGVWNAAIARDPPSVILSPIYKLNGLIPFVSKTYTLIMIDVTSALPTMSAGPPLFIHWVVTNINNGDFNSGTVVQDYYGPMPMRSPKNTYMFLLFEQSGPIVPNTLRSVCPSQTDICRAKLTDIIETWDLLDIVGVNWFYAKGDLYSIKRYNDLAGLPFSQLCAGREGYSTPCPRPVAQAVCDSASDLSKSASYLLAALFAACSVLNRSKLL